MSLHGMLWQILWGLPQTILLTISAFAGAALLGIPMLVLRRSRFFLARFIGTAAVMLIRGLPAIVWLFIVFFGLGSGYIKISPMTAAIITLAVSYGANLAETYRGGIAAIPRGQWEAAAALSLDRWHVARSVIAPQVFRVALPSMATYAIALLKDTSLASTIGVTELTYWGNRVASITYRGLEDYALLGFIYIVLSLSMALLTRAADRRLRMKVAH